MKFSNETYVRQNLGICVLFKIYQNFYTHIDQKYTLHHSCSVFLEHGVQIANYVVTSFAAVLRNMCERCGIQTPTCTNEIHISVVFMKLY